MPYLLSLSVLAFALTANAAAAAQEPPRAQAPARSQNQPRTTARAPSISVEVTDMSGNPVEGAAVTIAGSVDRAGVTGADGSVVLRNLRPGTYRLRFEKEAFVTLERELALRTQPANVSVALTAAPTPPEPPPAAPEPVAPPKPPARALEPRTLPIPDYLDANLIGSEPQKVTVIACMDAGTTRLVQIREPLTQEHSEVDELLYVIAGAGVIRLRDRDTKLEPGSFVLVPRGFGHTLRRDGRNPLIVMSVFVGAPCTDAGPPVR